MDMKEIRQKIDSLDDTINAAFEERMELCANMAAYKKANGLPVFHPAREREIVARLTADMDDSMATYTKVLYSTLFEVSRSLQSKRIYEGGKLSETIKRLKKQPLPHSPRPARLPVRAQRAQTLSLRLKSFSLFQTSCL